MVERVGLGVLFSWVVGFERVEVKHRSTDCTDYTDSEFFLEIADHQSVFYFLRKHRLKSNKTQTGRVLLNGNS